VNLSGSETYSIYWMHNPFTHSCSNSSGLTAGQSIAVGGPATGAANANAVTVDRVTLRNWGFNGTVVKGSQNSATGSFQLQINGFAGFWFPLRSRSIWAATATSASDWADSPTSPTAPTSAWSGCCSRIQPTVS